MPPELATYLCWALGLNLETFVRAIDLSMEWRKHREPHTIQHVTDMWRLGHLGWNTELDIRPQTYGWPKWSTRLYREPEVSSDSDDLFWEPEDLFWEPEYPWYLD